MPHLREGGGGGGAEEPGDIVGGVDISNPGQGGLNVVGSPS